MNRVRMGEHVVLSEGELEVRLVLVPGSSGRMFEVPEDFDEPLSVMALAVRDLLEEAKELPPDERQALADALWDSLESEPAALSPERTAEVSNRISELERGEIEAVPWSEVEATIQRTLGR
jgi:putative addiction module component (TIGR02574 family)